MNASWIYAFVLGVSIFTTGLPKRSTAGPQPATATAEETWTIPGAGRTPGQNNTFFVSDLALTNLGSATANATITFVGPGGLPAKPITLAAGATAAYRDILNTLWSATGLVGALSVESDQPLVLRARTYNTAATGTFGVALPVFRSGDLLDEGGTADSIWVQQSPSASSGFRTNVGVVFPDDAGGEAVVTFFDAAGTVAGSLSYSAPSAGFQQQSTGSALPAGLPVGRAQISVVRGHAAGYAVGVDNVTGDTSIYSFEELPAGVQDVVVSGVARLTGRNNTFFRTDARFYNPTAADAVVTALFHSIGASNPAPQSATISVPAGRVIESVDILDSILHLPVGSGGAVRFTSDQPVAILARTSNIDPQGIQPGTFGAQQGAVLLDSYLSSADAGAVVTAIRQDSSFRTNIGFAAGPDGAAYNLTLRNAQGGAVAVTTGTLGAFGWAQPSIADLFPGTTIPSDATLLVQVTSGAVDVYDASLDNASGDLVVTPIAPVPVAIPSSASIGPSGGSIQSDDGRLTLKVPAGALASATTLSISPAANTAPNAIGSAYSLTPASIGFARPAQAILSYSNEDLAGTGAGALGIASQDGSSWFAILGGSVDPVTRTLRVPVRSTSPSPASAGGEMVPQRTAQSGNLGPYGSVMLNPAGYSVVEEDTVQLGLIYVGPSSTQSAAPGFSAFTQALPNGAAIHWVVNHFTGEDVGTLASDGLQINVYTAPRCVPRRDNPVLIQVSVAVDQGQLPATVFTRILVIPKRWYLDVTYRVEHTCSAYLYSYYFEQSHTFNEFSIQDNLVRNFVRGPGHTQTEFPAAWCPGTTPEVNCTPPKLTLPGDLEVLDVTGTFDGGNRDPFLGLDPLFDLHGTVDFPGTDAFYTWTCGNPPEPFRQPVPTAFPRQATRDIQVLYRNQGRSIFIPETGETVTVTLRPRTCP
jgi:hypothetical protein